MKHEELIDFTQKILETNYLPVYKFTLPCETWNTWIRDFVITFSA